MPATLTKGLTSSMIMVTMLSLRVVSRCGSAASRNRIVEYWRWSAMQNSTGSGDFTNGCQNCGSAEGRMAYQMAVAKSASAKVPSANNVVRVVKIRLAARGSETLEGIDV